MALKRPARPYKMDFYRKTPRALNRPWAARTVGGEEVEVAERPLGQHLGSGRIVASDVEVPIRLVDLV